MTEILTPEAFLTPEEAGMWHFQMVNLIPTEVLPHLDLSRFKESITRMWRSHEALRAELVVAIENWQAQAEHDAERLADAQADIRALAEALQAITRGEGPYNRYPDLYLQGVIANGIQIAEEALARPGVKAVMEDAGAGLKAAVQAAGELP